MTSLCSVYKSPKKTDYFLYLNKRDDFSQIPKTLMDMFGRPIHVMTFDINRRQKLAIADLDKVKVSLSEQGYYLQIPPPTENLLDIHKSQQGKVD